MQRANRTALLTVIRNLSLYYNSSPPPKLRCKLFEMRDRGWVWNGRGYIWLEKRAREQGTQTSLACEGARRLDLRSCVRISSRQSHYYVGASYILCIEHQASQSGIEPGTSCTAGEHSMQRGIHTAFLTSIRNLSLYYYNVTNLSQGFKKYWNHSEKKILYISEINVR